MALQDGIIHDSLPSAQPVIVVASPMQAANGFPKRALEGNDDSFDGESTEPYFDGVDFPGKLLDRDVPRAPAVINKANPVGTKLEFRYHFLQFARLEIGKNGS